MNIITENLDPIINAPDGIKRLRELILQLAVTGGLTGAENRFPGTGKTHVKDYVKFLNGYAFKSKWFQSEGIRLVRNTNVSHGWLDWKDAACIAKGRKSEFERFALEKGDIVLSLDRPLIATGLKVAKIMQDDLPCLLLQRVAKAEFITNDLFPDFFLCWLQTSFFIDSIDPGRSKGVPHISTRQTEALKFCPPPLLEQKRIVAKVDELMAWCDALEALKEKRTALQKAALKASLNQLSSTTRCAGDTETQSSSVPPCLCGEKIFPLITSAADIKQLRDAILQLAVQGRLVPQHESDGTAADLLKQIETAKAADLERRKAAGERIRKTNPLPTIGKEEILFDCPHTWTVVRFNDIAEIERGGSPRPIKEFITDDPDGLNWIKIGDTEQGGKFITSTREKIRKEGLKKTRTVYPGDFLLTNSMSFGRPYITKIEGCIHDGWLRIHLYGELEADYFYRLLSSPFIAASFKKAAAGAVVLNLNAEKVREVPIPLPPLAEQQRIVAKVDELMAWCDKLETLLQTEAITATQFAAAIAQQGASQ